VTTAGRPAEPARGTYASFERQVARIANARSVTFGLAGAFFVLALAGAIVMRVADDHNFPSLGLAFWWALQTLTTVGYGDHVPTTTTGMFVGAIEMMIGIALITLLTAAVTSTVIQRMGHNAARYRASANPDVKRSRGRSERPGADASRPGSSLCDRRIRPLGCFGQVGRRLLERRRPAVSGPTRK
jgi:voltage-gated potassium channel